MTVLAKALPATVLTTHRTAEQDNVLSFAVRTNSAPSVRSLIAAHTFPDMALQEVRPHLQACVQQCTLMLGTLLPLLDAGHTAAAQACYMAGQLGHMVVEVSC